MPFPLTLSLTAFPALRRRHVVSAAMLRSIRSSGIILRARVCGVNVR